MKTNNNSKNVNNNVVNNTVEGELFTLPNQVMVYMADPSSPWNKWQRNFMSSFGYEPKAGEIFLQVVVTSDNGKTSWQDNQTLLRKLTGKENDSFPSYLPYDLIKDLQEGSILELRRDDGKIFKLQANQLKYNGWIHPEDTFESRLDRMLPIIRNKESFVFDY